MLEVRGHCSLMTYERLLGISTPAAAQGSMKLKKYIKISKSEYLSRSSLSVTRLCGAAGRRPAAVRPVHSCGGAGHLFRRPGQRDQAVVGGQRHPELLCPVTGVPAQRLCSIVSMNHSTWCFVRRPSSRVVFVNSLCTLIC